MPIWEKGHNKGVTARNRKLPADDIIKADIAAGFTIAEMAAKYAVSPKTLCSCIRRNGWSSPAASTAKAGPPILRETASKILLRREGVVAGRGNAVVEFMISLPRIPTLHGFYLGG